MRQCTLLLFFRTISTRVLSLLLLIVVIHLSMDAQAPDLAAELKAQINALPSEFNRELTKRNIATPPKEVDRPAVELAVEFVLRVRNKPALYALALNSQGGKSTKVAETQKAINAASQNAVNQFKADVDETRVDKQVGSAASSAGSTSLTSKGSVPAILGFAVENGALDSSTSGTSITFRGRPVQIIQALQKLGYNDSYKVIENTPGLGFLNRFSFALTFDASRTNQNATFTGSASQISAFSLHVDIINHRDPRDKRYDSQWNKLQAGVANEMAIKLFGVADQVLLSDTFAASFEPWLRTTADQVASALIENNDSLSQILDARFAEFPLPPDVASQSVISSFASATEAMLTARQDILKFVGTAPIVSVEYVNNRATPAVSPQPSLPDTSSFKVIAEFTPFSGGSFTSNGSFTVFNSQPKTISANRVRDAQFSSQLDIPVARSVPKIGNVVLSLSAKYQFIPDDVLTATTTVTAATNGPGLALRGNIGIGQAKLTIPIKGSGVKIPVSLTVSNRTELIKENDVRGNIGVTFDLDSIIGHLKP